MKRVRWESYEAHEAVKERERLSGKYHRNLSATVRSGSVGPVYTLEPGSGSIISTSPRLTSLSKSSGEFTATDSGLKVPSLSLSFAFSFASLARSPARALLASRVLRVGSSLEVPTSSFFWPASRTAFRVFRFVYGRVISFCARGMRYDDGLTRTV